MPKICLVRVTPAPRYTRTLVPICHMFIQILPRVTATGTEPTLDGSAINEAEWVVGVHGLALHYTGKDSVLISGSKLAGVQMPHVTMAAWVRPESNGGVDKAMFESSVGTILNKVRRASVY